MNIREKGWHPGDESPHFRFQKDEGVMLKNQTDGSELIQENNHRWPVWLVLSYCLICVAPFVLNQVGVEFGVSKFPFESSEFETFTSAQIVDALHISLHGSFIHTILEWSAFLIAILTAVFAWVYFSNHRKDVTTPVIAMALFYAGCMDAFHTLAADRMINVEADPVNLIPFTWAVCRLFNVLITMLGITLVLSCRKRSKESSMLYLGLSTLFLGVIAYATIHYCSISHSLPQTMFPDSWLTRPYDVAPMIMFLIAGVTVFRKIHKSNPSYFTYGLMLSLVPNIATQLHMAFGSSALFDNNFNIAHFLKIVSYSIPLTGLFLDYIQTNRTQASTVKKFQIVNDRLFEQAKARREVEHKLRSSESLTRGILETAADGIISIDASGIVLSCNPAAEKMFGHTDEDVVGKNISMLMPKSFAEKHDQYLEAYLETGVRNIIGNGREVIGLHKDGTNFPIELSVSEVQQGDDLIFTGFVRDISGRKKVEEDLNNYSIELEMANLDITRQADALAISQAEFEKASKAKSEFLANMSHELRTPLNAIIGFSEGLLSRIDKHPLNEHQKDRLSKVFHSGQHLLHLINDILDISKLEAGKLDLVRTTFDLEDLLEEIESISCGLLEANSSVEFFIAMEQEHVSLVTDRGKLKQILINLVSNALKFTEQGQVTIRVSLTSDQVAISVEDTGMGIPESDIHKVFDKFHQIRNASKKAMKGTGLGLSICSTFSELMGGELSIASTLGEGTTVTLTLPFELIDREKNVSKTKQTRVELDEVPEKRILYIEDDQNSMGVITDLLESTGYECLAAYNGNDGLKLAKKERPDVILLDLMLPDLPGMDVLRHLKSDKATSQIPVIIVSGLDDMHRKWSADAAGYVMKPVQANELQEVLRKVSSLPTIQGNRISLIDGDLEFQESLHEYLQDREFRVTSYSTAEDFLQVLEDQPENELPEAIVLELSLQGIDGFEVLETLKGDPSWMSIPIIFVTENDVNSTDLRILDRRYLALIEKYEHSTDSIQRKIFELLNSLKGEMVTV